ncbi:MAG: hypothetical protein LBR80_01250 [Deltaproteobacteria bacterium]|nr:hypothetical protein [Deltaproteobacteria bacterium]
MLVPSPAFPLSSSVARPRFLKRQPTMYVFFLPNANIGRVWSSRLRP